MAGKPYQSSLIPYEDEIITLRRKRPPMPYSQIAELLREKYQLKVCRETIFYFIKLRVKKGYRPCKYDAWDIEPEKPNNQPATETLSLQKQTCSAVISKPQSADSSFDPSKVEVTEYSPTWNLHRPKTEEEREAYRQYLRNEKLKQQ